ncbi:MAG: conserved putative rane protein [Parachlamydiales bacterium]|nr:conserved putative rane protein [Parachlamydiales bacterium]
MYVSIVILMFAMWSSIFPLAKLTLEHCPPLFLTAVRMLLAGLILLGFLAFRNRKAFQITPRQFFSLSLYALLSMYLTNAFEFWSVMHLSAAKTCFLYSLSPFFTAFFSYLHFGEKMNKRKWLGMSIGFLGIIPVLAIQTGSEDLIGGIFFLSWPELAMMGAALCSVYGWVLLRLLVKDSAISPSMANGTGMLIGGIFALTHSLIIDPWHPTPVAAGNFSAFAQGTLLMTFISNIVCYNIYGFMLKRFTATFLSFMGLLSPVFASLMSWLFIGEMPSPVIFASTAIVGSGLWLIYSAELKQGYIQKANTPVTAQ